VAASRHIVSVVGARPQFVKLAPICQAFESADSVTHQIVHTGQHYDDAMSNVFFEELSIPEPDVNLHIGSGGHGEQTGKMLAALESFLLQEQPAAVIVYGDTNSTLAACLAAAKLHIPVAHVEAGLRSFNRAMPEEINRVAADHCCDRLYAPTPIAIHNLTNENLSDRTVFSGDVMRDTVIRNLAIAEQRGSGSDAISGEFGVLTLHRPSNTGADNLPGLLDRIDNIAQQIVENCESRFKAITVVEPLAYLDMLATIKRAGLVITDSGGLQKEAAFVQTPCITLRGETEWTETVDIGVNRLSGTSADEIAQAVQQAGAVVFNAEVADAIDQCFGVGNAAKNIIQDLTATLVKR